jgi:hypothetical protein
MRPLRLWFIVSGFLLGLGTPAAAVSLTLAWDPPPNAHGLQYVVYYSTNGFIFEPLALVAEPSVRVTGLDEYERYYFYVTARNTSGEESDPSADLMYLTGMAGDINDNDRIDLLDVFVAHIVFVEGRLPGDYPVHLYVGRADLDADGEIGAADIAWLRYILTQF